MNVDTTDTTVLTPRQIADKWDALAQNLPFEAAGKLSAAATTWMTFLTAALGAFSIGGLAFLPSELAKLDSGLQPWVISLLFATLVAGLVARVLATLAMQVTPRTVYTDGEVYRDVQAASNLKAAGYLRASQKTTSVALLLLVTGVLLSLVPGAVKPFRLVTQQAGPLLCGKLVSDSSGAVYINKIGNATRLSNVTTISPVDSCPTAP